MNKDFLNFFFCKNWRKSLFNFPSTHFSADIAKLKTFYHFSKEIMLFLWWIYCLAGEGKCNRCIVFVSEYQAVCRDGWSTFVEKWNNTAKLWLFCVRRDHRFDRRSDQHTLLCAGALLPILRFVLDEKFQRNASKFAIFYIPIRKPKVVFAVFHFVLHYFIP